MKPPFAIHARALVYYAFCSELSFNFSITIREGLNTFLFAILITVFDDYFRRQYLEKARASGLFTMNGSMVEQLLEPYKKKKLLNKKNNGYFY